jgi:hypothetical protein
MGRKASSETVGISISRFTPLDMYLWRHTYQGQLSDMFIWRQELDIIKSASSKAYTSLKKYWSTYMQSDKRESRWILITSKEKLHALSFCHISSMKVTKQLSLEPAPWLYGHTTLLPLSLSHTHTHTRTYQDVHMTVVSTALWLHSCSPINRSDSVTYFVGGLINEMSISPSWRSRKRSSLCRQETELSRAETSEGVNVHRNYKTGW